MLNVNCFSTARCRHGFTLIELAMVLVLVSLMVGFGLQATQGPDKCYQSTSEQMAAIQAAMDKFVINNKRYPVPATKNAGPADPNFGTETLAAYHPSLVGATDKPLEFPGGPAQALVGALPFQALGLPPSFAADCWGNKFSYAVYNVLTSKAGFRDPTEVGTLPVITKSRANPVYLTQKAAYVVISHGPNGVGATPRNYPNPVTAGKLNCNSLVATNTSLDLPNCTTNNTLYFSAPFNTGTDPLYFFDDLIIFAEKPVFSCDLTGAAAITWGSGPTCSGTPSNPPTNRLAGGLALTVFNSPNADQGYTQVQCRGDGTLQNIGPNICYPGTWTQACSATCGGGTYTATCSSANPADCNPNDPIKLAEGTACNTAACSSWTATCPLGATQQVVACASGNPADCDPLTQPAPAACPTYGTWSQTCPVTCGGGTYVVSCSTGSDSGCDAATKPAGGACNTAACPLPGRCMIQVSEIYYENSGYQRQETGYCSTGNTADCDPNPCPSSSTTRICTDPVACNPGPAWEREGCNGGGCSGDLGDNDTSTGDD